MDDQKYYFLGYDYDEQVMFTNLDLWTDTEQKYIVKSNLFIKDILEEKSELIEDCAWYYQSMQELESSSIEDKIKRCFDIIEHSNTSEIELKPTKICDLVRGQAYDKELNQFYEVIGFIVENNIYLDGNLKANEKGFFSIYHSNCDESVPLIFERSFKDKKEDIIGKSFVAGNGDKVKVTELVIPSKKVNEYVDKTRLEKENNDERTL